MQLHFLIEEERRSRYGREADASLVSQGGMPPNDLYYFLIHVHQVVNQLPGGLDWQGSALDYCTLKKKICLCIAIGEMMIV